MARMTEWANRQDVHISQLQSQMTMLIARQPVDGNIAMQLDEKSVIIMLYQ